MTAKEEKLMSNPVVIALMVQINQGDQSNVGESLFSIGDGGDLQAMNSAELIRVIKDFTRGFESISNETVKTKETCKESEKKGNELLCMLNANERNVLRLVAEGKTNNEIARLVFRAPGRVKNIVSEILSKLYLDNRHQLVRYVYENNLMDFLKE
jgi:NarL family two-component system response regulator LiaR